MDKDLLSHSLSFTLAKVIYHKTKNVEEYKCVRGASDEIGYGTFS